LQESPFNPLDLLAGVSSSRDFESLDASGERLLTPDRWLGRQREVIVKFFKADRLENAF
jgi:hypothetical protein